MSSTRLTAAQLDAMLKSGNPLNVLDARDPQSHARARIDGAHLLNRESLEGLLKQLPRTQPVVIYCYHGHASQTYATMFSDFRFEQVHDLIGGWTAWEQHLAQPRGRPLAAISPLPSSLQDWLHAHGYRGNDLEEAAANRTTPLMQAAREGDAVAVRALLAVGADVHARNADGNTALWLACFAEALPAIDALIDGGAALNHQNDNGATCLMMAASTGKAEVVRRLLKAGADATLQSLDDYTALDMAATLDCLRLLREAERRALASRPGDL